MVKCIFGLMNDGNSISKSVIISKLFLWCLPQKSLQASIFRDIEWSLKNDGSLPIFGKSQNLGVSN